MSIPGFSAPKPPKLPKLPKAPKLPTPKDAAGSVGSAKSGMFTPETNVFGSTPFEVCKTPTPLGGVPIPYPNLGGLKGPDGKALARALKSAMGSLEAMQAEHLTQNRVGTEDGSPDGAASMEDLSKALDLLRHLSLDPNPMKPKI